jgi:hypothetical protein
VSFSYLFHLQCVSLKQTPRHWVCEACVSSGRGRGGKRSRKWCHITIYRNVRPPVWDSHPCAPLAYCMVWTFPWTLTPGILRPALVSCHEWWLFRATLRAVEAVTWSFRLSLCCKRFSVCYVNNFLCCWCFKKMYSCGSLRKASKNENSRWSRGNRTVVPWPEGGVRGGSSWSAEKNISIFRLCQWNLAWLLYNWPWLHLWDQNG